MAAWVRDALVPCICAALHLLLLVVEVGTSQQVAKNELWNVNLLGSVHFNGNAATRVEDADFVLLGVDGNTKGVHRVIALLVVSRVHY